MKQGEGSQQRGEPQLTNADDARAFLRAAEPSRDRDVALALACRLAPFFRPNNIAIRLMDWGDRCEPPWDYEELQSIAADALAAHKAEQAVVRAANAGPSIGYRPRRRQSKRTMRPGVVKAIARELGVTGARVYQMITDGTTDPANAAVIAEHWGGEPDDYMRHARPRGRRRDRTAIIMKLGDEFPYRDYVAASDDFNAFTESMRRRYRRGPTPPGDFHTLESLLDFARANDIPCDGDLPLLGWKEFKRWRVLRVLEATRADVDAEFQE